MNGIGRVTARKLHTAFDRTAGRANVTRAIRILRGTLPPESVEGVPDRGHRVSRQLQACDALLGTHGVEVIRDPKADFDADPVYEYLNTGDSYAATLVYASERHRSWLVVGWGDLVERMEG